MNFFSMVVIVSALVFILSGYQLGIQASTGTLNAPSVINYAQLPDMNIGSLQIPNINVPNIQQTDVNIPNAQLLSYDIPNLQQFPTYNIPNVQLPTYSIPNIQLPIYNSIDVQTYNPLLTNNLPFINQQTIRPPGIYIESHSNQCYQKQFTFQTGDVEISFDFKILSTFQLSQSALFVTFNNQQIYKVLPCDNGKTIKIIVPKVPAGQHVIGFVPQGCITEPKFTFFISNFFVQQKICVPQWSHDLIKNGGFQDQACKSSYCIWNKNTFKPEFLPGWIPNPEVEVGAGTVYNSRLINTKVIELDSNLNTCIKQKLSLKAGTYNLKFDWAAREGTNFSTNGIDAKINGKVIKSVTPCDYKVNSQSIQFTLDSENANSQIQFCGTGKSNSYGSLLDNVKLFYYDLCGSYKINKCQ